MQKNQMVTVTIEDMGVGGEGIGKVDGYTLFVKDAVIGDVAEVKVTKAKKHYGYARLMKILSPSEERIEPKCRFARRCGGCQIQEMSYESQLRFKQEKVQNNLERIGGFSRERIEQISEPIVGMAVPFYYRNKAQFPIGTEKEGNPVAGFYAGRTHDIIANTDCALGVPENKKILEILLDFMKNHQIPAYDEKTGQGLVRHILIRYGFTTKEVMVCLVLNRENRSGAKHERAEINRMPDVILKKTGANGDGNGRKNNCGETVAQWLPYQEELIQKLQKISGMTSICISSNTRRDNVIMGDSYEVLWGQPFITDYIGENQYQISPLSFYQVNPVQTEKLYGLALEYADLNGTETVWDLYCGIGTISLFLAHRAKQVYGVEIVPQAIEDARRNAKINAIENVEFYVGKAEEILPEYYKDYEREHPGQQAHADVIVVDPPRKGCDSTLLETIVKMAPDKVVYVSCDSATLARDLKMLCENGYELKRVRAVDQFPNTVHVETVVLLSQHRDKSTCLDERSSRQIEMQASRLASLLAQKPDDTIESDLDLDELDATSAELKARD